MTDNRRNQLLGFVEREFIGPDPIDCEGMLQKNGEEILTTDAPRTRYIAGILFPRETSDADTETRDDETGDDADEEEHGPLDEWPIESLHSFLDEGSLVVEVFQREEVAGCDEEQGHVELEDELAEPSWSLRMGNDHQDDGDAFGDGYGGVARHSQGVSRCPSQPRKRFQRERFWYSSSVRRSHFLVSSMNLSSSCRVTSLSIISALIS